MEIMNLGFSSDPAVPASGTSEENGACSVVNTPHGVPCEGVAPAATGDVPPWEWGEVTPPWECAAPEQRGPQELEIHRKAERFKSLNLLSGNSIEGGVTEEYIRGKYGLEGVQRFRLAKFVLDGLGYIVSPDVLLMLSCTNRARIVIATAGAGKTTSLQFDLVISKMLDKATGAGLLAPEPVDGTTVALPRILYLNYNKHNVRMISERHTAVCAAVNKMLKKEDGVTDELESSTVHAFCHKWLKAFAPKLELPELAIISDDTKSNIWSAIIKPRWKKFYGESEDNAVEYGVLDDLYNYKTESMLDWPEFFLTAKFIDSGLNPDFTKACIKKYDSMKKQMKLMDFTDYLVLMTETLRSNPELRRKLQERYRIIIADENQDFTRLMNELLIQLYDPEINRLVIVGDPDQTIYDFKGVSPDNVVSLAEALPDTQLLGFDTNYRCPSTIVDAAKEILKLNILRFEKSINTVRTGGRIIQHALRMMGNQHVEVIDILKKIGPAGWPSTVVTYRNNVSSIIVAEEMYYAGIPFQTLDDRRPFNNPVFKQIYRALIALKEKDNFELNKDLHRFIPLKKEEWVSILEDNRASRRSHLHDLILPSDLPKGTMDALKTLVTISVTIDTQPVSEFIASLLRLYRTYYFDFIVRQSNFVVQDADNYLLYLERATKFFSRNMSFEYMQAELRERNVDNSAGVSLSTFHGLKGLEFDYVLAIDFNESIFPDYFGIEQKYSQNTAMEEKESANRLCYVLVTRTIKEFHTFYDINDPSVYVGILSGAVKTEKAIEGGSSPSSGELTLGMVGGASDNDSRMSFVKRILGNRG